MKRTGSGLAIAAVLLMSAVGCGGNDSPTATQAVQELDSEVVSCVPAWQEYAKTLDPQMTDPTGKVRSTRDLYAKSAAFNRRWNCKLSRERNGNPNWCYSVDGETAKDLGRPGWPTDELESNTPTC